MENISIRDKEYPCIRCKLRRWIKLEVLRRTLNTKSITKYCDALIAYVSFYLEVPAIEIEEIPWTDLVDAYSKISSVNTPNLDLPLYKAPASKNNKKEIWDYDGRTWFIWLHELAHAYGWSIEYVAELDVDDAASLLQEIYTQEQLDKEFVWSTTEIAYPYNETSKTSDFHPLSRPDWMTYDPNIIKKVEDLQHTKILKSLLPMGMVVRQERPDVAH